MDIICSKCGKIALGYEGIGYTMIDGKLYCPDCVPEIKPEWIRDVRNGSMFYDMDPDMYYTSIEELCNVWGAKPNDLKFRGRMKIEILWPNGNSPWNNHIGHFFKKSGKINELVFCSKCKKSAKGYYGLATMIVDGKPICLQCALSLETNLIADIRNHSTDYTTPKNYYTSIKELCKAWGANPKDLTFRGRGKTEIIWKKDIIGYRFKKETIDWRLSNE